MERDGNKEGYIFDNFFLLTGNGEETEDNAKGGRNRELQAQTDHVPELRENLP